MSLTVLVHAPARHHIKKLSTATNTNNGNTPINTRAKQLSFVSVTGFTVSSVCMSFVTIQIRRYIFTSSEQNNFGLIKFNNCESKGTSQFGVLAITVNDVNEHD